MARRHVRTLLIAAASGLLASGCTSDPAFWDAMAQGLNEAAADLDYQNANCYWAPPPGLPYGAVQQYCPGDYGYRDIYIPPSRPTGGSGAMAGATAAIGGIATTGATGGGANRPQAARSSCLTRSARVLMSSGLGRKETPTSSWSRSEKSLSA